MARARNIKPGLFRNEILGQSHPDMVLLFIGLWCLADRDGRLEDRPLRIKADLFPYRAPDVNRYLTDLERLGFIHRYEVNGARYMQVVNFRKHQNPHKTERPSDIPEPPIKSDSCRSTVKAPLSNGELTEPARLIPDSLFTDSLIPDSGFSDSPIPDSGKKDRADVAQAHRDAHREIWAAYSGAYRNRYGVEPVRNAKTAGQVAQLRKRLGQDAAPVAAYYCGHSAQWYTTKGHAFGTLLADAEKLHTEWQTGRQITSTTARIDDRTAHHRNVFDKLIAEARAEKEAQQ
jgi:hypothetical protein